MYTFYVIYELSEYKVDFNASIGNVKVIHTPMNYVIVPIN